MDRSGQEALIRRYVAAYNAFDIDGMAGSLHRDVTFRNISSGVMTHECVGLAAFTEQAKKATAIFAARRQTITASTPLVDGGDPGLRVGIAYRATLATDLPNGMKAGDTLEVTGESEFRFRDGRIVSIVDRA